jgi:hypothetical protein
MVSKFQEAQWLFSSLLVQGPCILRYAHVSGGFLSGDLWAPPHSGAGGGESFRGEFRLVVRLYA